MGGVKSSCAKQIHCEWFLLSLDDFVGILQRQREQKDIDSEKLASARKRLQENYKEAENGLVICFFLFLQFFWVFGLGGAKKPNGITAYFFTAPKPNPFSGFNVVVVLVLNC